MHGGWLGSDCRRTTDHCLWPLSAVRPQQASLGNGRRAGGDLPVRFTRTFRPKSRQIDPSHPAVTPKGHHDLVTSIAFSPDGKFLASGSADGIIKLWNVELGKAAQ